MENGEAYESSSQVRSSRRLSKFRRRSIATKGADINVHRCGIGGYIEGQWYRVVEKKSEDVIYIHIDFLTNVNKYISISIVERIDNKEQCAFTVVLRGLTPYIYVNGLRIKSLSIRNGQRQLLNK